MAKIICENAKEMTTSSGLHPYIICDTDCPICHGAGFTEQDVVKVSDVEEEFLKICKKWDFENPRCITSEFENWIISRRSNSGS